jgi:hypothetical protein
VLFFKKELDWKYFSGGVFFREGRIVFLETNSKNQGAERLREKAIIELSLHQQELSREQQQYWGKELDQVSREIQGVLNPDIAETIAQRFLEKVEYYTGPVLGIMQKIGRLCEGFGDEYLTKKVLKAAQKVSDSTEMNRDQKLFLLNEIFASSHVFGNTWNQSYQVIRSSVQIQGETRALFSSEEQRQYSEALKKAIHGNRKSVDPNAAIQRLTDVQKEILKQKKERETILQKGEKAIETKNTILAKVGYFESLEGWSGLAQQFSILAKAFPEEHPLNEFFAMHAQQSAESIQIALTEGMTRIEVRFRSFVQSASWEDSLMEYATLLQKIEILPKGLGGKVAHLQREIKEAHQLCEKHIQGKAIIADIQKRRKQLEQSPSAQQEDFDLLLHELQNLPPALQQIRKKDIAAEQALCEEAKQKLEANEDEQVIDLEALSLENANVSYLLASFDLWCLQSKDGKTPDSAELPSLTTQKEIEQSARDQLGEALKQTEQPGEIQEEAILTPPQITNEVGETIEVQDISTEGITANDIEVQNPESPTGKQTLVVKKTQNIHRIDLGESSVRRGTNSEKALMLSGVLENSGQVRFGKDQTVFNDGELVVEQIARRIASITGEPSQENGIKTALRQRKEGSTTEESVRTRISQLGKMSD